MISIKRHRTGNDLLVAACDADLLGRHFCDGELCLEIRRAFYEGERVDVRLFLEVLAIATIANLAGEETVKAASEAGFVDPDCVIRIQGVPHAQIVRM
jgi:hypothetical protein